MTRLPQIKNRNLNPRVSASNFGSFVLDKLVVRSFGSEFLCIADDRIKVLVCNQGAIANLLPTITLSI